MAVSTILLIFVSNNTLAFVDAFLLLVSGANRLSIQSSYPFFGI